MPDDGGILIRPAAPADLPTVLRHRRRMFEDMGYADETALAAMDAASAVFLGPKLEDGSYRGWLAVDRDSNRVVAGGGIVFLEFQPHPRNAVPRRAWIINMFTEPSHRRRGLARRLLETMIRWCREAGLGAVYLHASDDGRALYESMGFVPNGEMRLDLPAQSA